MTSFVWSQLWNHHLSRSLGKSVCFMFKPKLTRLIWLYKLRSHKVVVGSIFAHYPSDSSHVISFWSISCFKDRFQALLTLIVRNCRKLRATRFILCSRIVKCVWVQFNFLVIISSSLWHISSLSRSRRCCVVVNQFRSSRTDSFSIPWISCIRSVSSVDR